VKIVSVSAGEPAEVGKLIQVSLKLKVMSRSSQDTTGFKSPSAVPRTDQPKSLDVSRC
jgi:hypothetical protein